MPEHDTRKRMLIKVRKSLLVNWVKLRIELDCSLFFPRRSCISLLFSQSYTTSISSSGLYSNQEKCNTFFCQDRGIDSIHLRLVHLLRLLPRPIRRTKFNDGRGLVFCLWCFDLTYAKLSVLQAFLPVFSSNYAP